MQVSKIFDWHKDGKCTSLYITVDYDPVYDAAERVLQIQVFEQPYLKDGESITYSRPPSILADITEVMQCHFPDFIEEILRSNWHEVYEGQKELKAA